MKPSISAGLAVGCATGTWMFSEYALGLHDDPAGAGRWTGFVALIFPLLGARWVAAKSALRSWGHACRAGLEFGLLGGLVGGAAICLYYTQVNPGFRVGGRPVDAGTQALVGALGALVLGLLLTVTWHAILRKRSDSHG